MLEKFNVLTSDVMVDVLAGIDQPAVAELVKHLAEIKDNLRDAIASRARDTQVNTEERHYG